ncbi:uncharacterized protein LOC135695627 [Rhopilema esculentum]|uniref:uncharacterized protein LOC135695627 n=1 Tax=Rhopilema esculentum TaxID=499914 RepID=UPI0031D3CD2A
MITFVITLILATVSVNTRHLSLRSGLSVIRDKVTPEEISEVILNPRRSDLSSLSVGQNQIDAAKIQTIIEEQHHIETQHEREVRAVQQITTRLIKKAEEDLDYTPDHFVNKSRLKRVVMTQGNHKPKPMPAAFLNAVARIIVPARPESKSTENTAEAKPRLLRLSTPNK